MDLRAKLKLYQKTEERKQVSPVKQKNLANNLVAQLEKEQINELTNSENQLTKLLPCKEIHSHFGDYLLAEYRYPLNYFHGHYRLGALLTEDLHALSGVLKDHGTHCPLNIESLIFLDTETTGLAGGAGTFAFLIGIGYFTKEEFVVQQYMMDDYHQELAILDSLYQKLQSFTHLVTFNGRIFDWPLLEGRFIYHRMKSRLCFTHVDLLHPTRRYYKRRLENCKLGHLEDQVLGFYREGDISGAEVPALFFKYLQERDGKLLVPVFRHNHWDILTLVTLLIHLMKAYLLPEEVLKNPEDFFSAGKIHEDLEEFDQAIACYCRSLAEKKSISFQQDVLTQLSFLYKRLGKMDEACHIWEEFIGSKTNLQLFPYLELAKYFEHQCKDYQRALEITQAGYELLASQRRLYSTLKYKELAEEITHRENRLLKKLEKKEQQSSLLGLD